MKEAYASGPLCLSSRVARLHAPMHQNTSFIQPCTALSRNPSATAKACPLSFAALSILMARHNTSEGFQYSEPSSGRFHRYLIVATAWRLGFSNRPRSPPARPYLHPARPLSTS